MNEPSEKSENANAPTVIHLQRPALWSAGLIFASVIAVLYGIDLVQEIKPRLSEETLFDDLKVALTVFSCYVLGLIAILLRRAWIRKKPLPPFIVADQYIAFPRHLESNEVVQVPYTELMALSLRGHPSAGRIVVETGERSYILAPGGLESENEAERIALGVRERVLMLPDGNAIIERMQSQRNAAMVLLERKPWATHGLMGICGVFFLNMVMSSSIAPPTQLIAWGALVPALLKTPQEIYRTLSHTVVLDGPLEALMAMLLLYHLGSALERLIGTARTIILYGICLMAGSAGVMLVGTRAIYAGPWALLAGVLGALFAIHRSKSASLPPGYRQPGGWALRAVVLMVLAPTFLPTDLVHIGAGFIVGLIAGFMMPMELPKPLLRGAVMLQSTFSRQAVLQPAFITACLLVGLFASALGASVVFASRFDGEAARQSAALLIEDPRTPATELNRMAWHWAIDPNAPESDVRVAENAARVAVMREPGEPMFSDTHAYTLNRLGSHEEAIALQREVVRMQPAMPIYARHLADFLIADPKPLVGVDGFSASVREDASNLTLPPTLTLAGATGAGPFPQEIFALLAHDKEPLALVRAVVVVEPGKPIEKSLADLRAVTPPQEGAHWRVVSVRPAVSADPQRWLVWVFK